jgi:hypothetical protein
MTSAIGFTSKECVELALSDLHVRESDRLTLTKLARALAKKPEHRPRDRAAETDALHTGVDECGRIQPRSAQPRNDVDWSADLANQLSDDAEIAGAGGI